MMIAWTRYLSKSGIISSKISKMLRTWWAYFNKLETWSNRTLLKFCPSIQCEQKQWLFIFIRIFKFVFYTPYTYFFVVDCAYHRTKPIKLCRTNVTILWSISSVFIISALTVFILVLSTFSLTLSYFTWECCMAWMVHRMSFLTMLPIYWNMHMALFIKLFQIYLVLLDMSPLFKRNIAQVKLSASEHG